MPSVNQESAADAPSSDRFRCESSDDFVEARIALQRVPFGMQLQSTIAEVSRLLDHSRQLLNRKIVLTRPSVNDGQVSHHVSSSKRVLCDREQFDSASPLANRLFFATETSVNHPKYAKRLRIARLLTHHLLDFGAGGHERGTRRSFVTAGACGETFIPGAGEPNILFANSIGRNRCKRAIASGGITLAQGELEPLLSKTACGSRILGNDGLNDRVHRFWVRARFEINPSSCNPRNHVAGHKRECVIQYCSHVCISTKQLISRRK